MFGRTKMNQTLQLLLFERLGAPNVTNIKVWAPGGAPARVWGRFSTWAAPYYFFVPSALVYPNWINFCADPGKLPKTSHGKQ